MNRWPQSKQSRWGYSLPLMLIIIIIVNFPMAGNSSSNILGLDRVSFPFSPGVPIAGISFDWITNGTFDQQGDWYSDIEGDGSDHAAFISKSTANYIRALIGSMM